MTACFITKSELERIKAALEVESKHQYIDIKGKECPFSVFMKRESKKIYSSTENKQKWAAIAEAFEFYPFETFIGRKRTVSRFISLLKAELNPEELTRNSDGKTAKKESIYESDVTFLRGVGPKTALLLNKLGIYTVFDLLTYYPKKYIDYSCGTYIKDLKDGADATVFGKITNLKAFTTKRNLTVLNVTIEDETGRVQLTFFYAKLNRYMLEHYKSAFPKGAGIIVSGRVKFDNYAGCFVLSKPEYQIAEGDSEDNANLNLGRIVPIYGLCENLNIKTLRRAVGNALNDWGEKIENLIPDDIREKYSLSEKKEAIRAIHFPKDFEEASKARFTLVFEELFLLELKLGIIKREYGKTIHPVPLEVADDGLVQRFLRNLPFELTSAQKRAINEIFNDINSGSPMQRLLQGDVGSGKTVVACTMLLAAVENGYQAAIMAPTEILATQHFNTFINLLTPLGINTALFTSSNSKKQRAKLETDLRNGQINIAVGTHALLRDNVEFKNLGAVIIDEQHRFGVKQRNELKSKASIPQMLSMSATPIPRSLALTVHGDLDLTVIDELPAGRKEIKTTLVKSAQRNKVYDLIRREVEQGHAAYIVFPLIEESETISAKAATAEAEKLKSGVFKDLKVGLLHGKMKTNEKDEVMKDFKSGKYDVLVTTTVIEVGVDIPRATVMVIENAERFGLSQLHQLRGRVGRNELQSYCVLVSSSSSEDTLRRLEIMTRTNDGFIIAETDLKFRGPGEFLGLRQSGLPELNLTDLTKDLEILEIARNSAIKFLKTENIEKFPNLLNYSERNFNLTKNIGIPD